MKKKLIILGALALAVGSANATISLSTTAAVGLKASNPANNIASGSLVMLIVDNGNDGFLNLAETGGAITTGSTSNLAARTVLAANTSITAGQYFGGDLILGTFAAAGGGSVSPAGTFTIEGYEGAKFALVWFEDTAANLAGGRVGESFGIASGADWTLPATDSGAAYTFHGTTNTTTSVYWQLASATSATQIGVNGFFSGSGTAGVDAVKSATFSIVPEPSGAMIAALGVFGLIRRRRN